MEASKESVSIKKKQLVTDATVVIEGIAST
jgi:hypothetical protein